MGVELVWLVLARGVPPPVDGTRASESSKLSKSDTFCFSDNFSFLNSDLLLQIYIRALGFPS